MANAKLTFGKGSNNEDFKLKKAILSGKKKVTTRIHNYGKIGDTFDFSGVKFKITSVRKMTLGKALSTQYKLEGCRSPEEFKKFWLRFHIYRDRWPMSTKVFVYHFTRLKSNFSKRH
jgi:hypothetical protein